MSDTNYTEEQIEWALEELKKKDPKWATREQAIKLLDKFGELGNSVVDESPPTRMLEYLLPFGDKIKKDRKSGKLTPEN